ncbi:CBS domain-containing protein [Streptosporangium subroseum]|uniref:CBS domain-containing protein n=1 Tax=Streptosporangium subroseum TaxID=106412 RepID=UPI003415FC33
MYKKVRDVMTWQVASVNGSTPFKDVAEVLVRHGVSAAPVVDGEGHVIPPPPPACCPRLLAGRQAGPVFLADRRAPSSGRRASAAADICPVTGRGRLSYPRAEYLFKTASVDLDPHGDGWTLHQLRHSALTHLAAAGRTAPELQAKSRHQHLASLGRYVRLGEETSARITAEHDLAARRRRFR